MRVPSCHGVMSLEWPRSRCHDGSWPSATGDSRRSTRRPLTGGVDERPSVALFMRYGRARVRPCASRLADDPSRRVGRLRPHERCATDTRSTTTAFRDRGPVQRQSPCECRRRRRSHSRSPCPDERGRDEHRRQCPEPRADDALFLRYYARFDAGFNVVGIEPQRQHHFGPVLLPGRSSRRSEQVSASATKRGGTAPPPRIRAGHAYIYQSRAARFGAIISLPNPSVLPFSCVPFDFGPEFVSGRTSSLCSGGGTATSHGQGQHSRTTQWAHRVLARWTVDR